MNNPWETAYTHPNFAEYTREEIDEMLFCELQEIFNKDQITKLRRLLND